MSTPPKRVELTPEQRARLARLAEHTGKDWRQVLDEAIGAFKQNEAAANGVSAESYFDIASRHGLIGCIKGTPTDLSTNPAYMEGFGQDERLVQLRAAVKVGLDELDRAQGQPWDKEEVWREVQRRLSERQQTFEDSHG